MKLIKPSFEILPTTGSIEKDIERAARTCYKSEENIKEGSAEKMVKFLIERGHTAMLEHGTVYLKISPQWNGIVDRYEKNKYSKVTTVSTSKVSEDCYITTNYRVLVENNWLDDLQYQCEPTEYHEKRVSVRFICDRGVSHELVRHRVFSFAQESTRYCNYSKDKFGSELTFIIPNWFRNEIEFNNEDVWLDLMQKVEDNYNFMIKNGWQPQQARTILPNSLKTELIMTGFVSDWEGFFKLRDASTAHPQMQELACPLHEEFKKLNLI